MRVMYNINIELIEPQNIVNKLVKRINKKDVKFVILFILIGIITYFPMINKWLTNPDGLLYSLYYRKDHNWENAQGRFGLYYFDKLKNDYIFPVNETLFCIVLLAIISVLIYKIFNCDNYSLICLIIGFFIILSPNVSNLLTYYYCSSAYSFSYLLAVIAAYFLTKKKEIKTCVIAGFCIMISLSLYQAYIGVTITLVLTYLIYLIIIEERIGRNVYTFLMRSLITGGAGVISYLLVYKVIQLIKGFTPVTNRGFNQMGKIDMGQLPFLIKSAYLAFGQYFFSNRIVNNSWKGRIYLNVLYIVLFLILFFIIIVKTKIYKEVKCFALLCISILLIPLSLCCITIVAPGASIYDETGILMLPQMNLFYIFIVILCMVTVLKEKKRTFVIIINWITTLLSIYLISTLWIYTNIFQACLNMNLDKTYNLATRIVTRMEMLDGHYTGMKILMYGRMERGNYPDINTSMIEVTKGSVARYGLFWEEIWDKQNCWTEFLRQYLGIYYLPCERDVASIIIDSEDFNNMPIFPENGSVKIINDVMVVKLSEK